MCSTTDSSTNVLEKDITEDEAQLYDRQIRLWGVEAQRKLRKADIALIGLSSVGAEIAKNLVLCGIRSLTIVDDKKVSCYDSLSHLFTRRAVGKNRGKVSEPNIKTLNPMVKVTVHDWNVAQAIADDDQQLKELLKNVDVVCVTNYDSKTILQLNRLYRSLRADNIKFYAVCCWGFFGFSFTDLGKIHEYFVEEVDQSEVEVSDEPSKKKVKSEEHDKSFVPKSLSFVPFETFLSVKAGKSGVGLTKRTNAGVILAHIMFKFYSKHNRYPLPFQRENDVKELKALEIEVIEELGVDEKILSKCDAEQWWEYIFEEISPVCAVVGGVVGQDIIRAVSAQDHPIKNVFLFDGLQCNGFIESIGK